MGEIGWIDGRVEGLEGTIRCDLLRRIILLSKGIYWKSFSVRFGDRLQSTIASLLDKDGVQIFFKFFF